MIRDWLILARPFTLLTPAVGVMVGGYAALATIGEHRPHVSWFGDMPLLGAVGIGAAAAALLNASSNAINQICDLTIDRIAKPRRPIPAGRISVGAAWVFVVLSAGVALGLAVGASSQREATGAVFGAAALLTWAYSARPLRLRRFGWIANITIAIPRGLLLAAAGWSMVAPLTWPDPWVIGMVPAFYLIGAATTKDFADMDGDRADGVRTLPVALGVERAAKVMSPFLVFPFLMLAGFGVCAALGMFQPWGAQNESVRGLLTPSWLDGLFRAANGWVLSAGGVLLALWGWKVGALIRRDPAAMTSTENHPSWRHMYLMMLSYYGCVWVAYASEGW